MRLILLAAAMLLAPLPALAQRGDDMAPARLAQLDDQAKARGFHLFHAKAIEIAMANGMASVREVELEDGDRWKVEGRDAAGRELEIELSGHDGKVLKVERD